MPSSIDGVGGIPQTEERLRERAREAEDKAKARTAEIRELKGELARVRGLYARVRSSQGATHPEIGDELGITASAVCHLLRRAVEAEKDRALS